MAIKLMEMDVIINVLWKKILFVKVLLVSLQIILFQNYKFMEVQKDMRKKEYLN